jgi:hypothetical protein
MRGNAPPSEAFGLSLPAAKKPIDIMGPPDGADESLEEEQMSSRWTQSTSTPSTSASYNSYTPSSTASSSASYNTDDLIRKYGGMSGIVPSSTTSSSRTPSCSSKSNDDNVRNQALKVLDLADEKMGGSSKSPASRRLSYAKRHDFKVEEEITFGGSINDSPSSRRSKRVPAALAGINCTPTSRERSFGANSAVSITSERSLDVEEEFEDEIIDDSLGSRSAYKDDPSNRPYSDNSSTWSSRYSTDSYRKTQQRTLDKWYNENSRESRGGTNMFLNTMRSAVSSPSKASKNDFGPGFSFRENHVFGRQQKKQEVDLRSAWKEPTDEDVYGGTRRHKTWEEVILNRRKRRVYLYACLLIGLSIILVPTITEVILPLLTPTEKWCDGCDIGAPVSFYVTSDAPYTQADAQKLSKDLSMLSNDGDFLVHLGNIQDSSVSFCSKSRYAMAESILKTSPLPTFVLPGQEDWANCPDPEHSLKRWREHFVQFDEHFTFPQQVYRNSDYPEIYAMLHSGVLFVGLHLVSGPMMDSGEWSDRRKSMLNFYFGMANMHKDEFRAIVLMGNSRPTPQIEKFFTDLFKSLEPVGKPVAYIHANSGYGDIMEYHPFPEQPTLFGIQVENGGDNPPLKIDVGLGNKPFSVAPQVF